ncbi:hypothetical protein [Nocardia pseudobrasiliensis]|uniref:Uncharacterized protein n=1 Tax=Nocardia pseudobrasiliensis TaxID=45979 RepID=A0A370I895_9NOCA|nr:hypothetical protein [Nocardia pseudobrasiliensis]RDI66955.1 hypothetical protein DFR76_10326 [Nocardia pseudobrasiliensis]
MKALKANVTRWYEDGCPPWVEIQFPLADEKTATLIEKTVAFEGGDDLTAATTYPVPVRLDCQVLHTELDQSGRQVAVVTLEYDLEDLEGNTEFRVPIDCLEGLADT